MRIARAKRKGTYDPSIKYNTCPYYDALKFIAQGRSERGLHNQSLQVHRDIKVIMSNNSAKKVSEKAEDLSNISSQRENNPISATVIEADSQSKCANFKSYTVAVYTQKIDCKNGVYGFDLAKNFPNNEDISLIQKSLPSAKVNSGLSCGGVNIEAIIYQTEPDVQVENPAESGTKINSNNNCRLKKRKAINELDYKVANNNNKDKSVTQNNKVTTPAIDLCNAELKNPSTLPPENISHLMDSTDYEFLNSFISRLKKMSHLQKLKFRAEVSSLMLDIFSSSHPVKHLNKQVLFGSDNDPDKKFLLSFLPFLKSMSVPQNLQFRKKISALVLNITSANAFCCSATSVEC